MENLVMETTEDRFWKKLETPSFILVVIVLVGTIVMFFTDYSLQLGEYHIDSRYGTVLVIALAILSLKIHVVASNKDRFGLFE